MAGRGLSGLLLLVAAVLGSSYLFLRARDETSVAAPERSLGVGYYARRARLTGTDDTGRILFRIAADEVEQQPADGSVAMRTVSLDYDPTAELPWELTAAAGTLPAGGKMVELSGNVVATSREDGSPAAIIRTDFLRFDPETRIAETDRKVVIEYAGSTVNAIGLRALLSEDRLELLSAVEGRYVRALP